VNADVKPSPLTPEEQAIWDQLAIRWLDRGAPAADCYTLTKGAALDLIKARREALANLPMEAAR